MTSPTPHSPGSVLRRAALLLALAPCMAAAPAMAQDGNHRDDRFTLRLSAFNPSADLRMGIDGEATADGMTMPFSEAGSLDTGDEWRPRGSLSFRISDRQSIGASYYDYENDDRFAFGGGIFDPGPPQGPVDVPPVDATGRIKFAMASAHYEYAVIATPTFEWGLGIGATHVDLDAVADVAWGDAEGVEAGEAQFAERLDGWSPAVHTRLTWRPVDRWRVDFEGQYLDAGWGDFVDESGHFERAGIVVEYLLNERIGLHVGYDWFRLKLRDGASGTFVPPPEAGVGPVDYDATVRSELKVHGPLAGLTVRF